MRIQNKIYKCDKCGITKGRDEVYSLQCYYAPTGLGGYRQGNFGIKHLCEKCKPKFDALYAPFFSYKTMIEEQANHNIVELATELAYRQVIKAFDNETERIYKMTSAFTEYTDEAQDIFDLCYDEYLDVANNFINNLNKKTQDEKEN